MRQPRVYSTDAFILKRSDFGEADRLLTLLTPKTGKVKVVAKGVRRTTSRLAGNVELFTVSHLLLASGRDLDIITQAETRERFDHLTDKVWAGTCAYYMSELVDRFLGEEVEHYDIYQLLIDALRFLDGIALSDAREASSLLLRYFELQLLDHLGYRVSLHQCASCGGDLLPQENGYNAALGGTVCQNCSHHSRRTISLNTLKVCRLLQRSTLTSFPKIRLTADIEHEIEAVIQSNIRYQLEREIKSWDLLHTV